LDRETLFSQIFNRLKSIPENDGRMYLLNSTNLISLKRIILPITNLHRYKVHMREFFTQVLLTKRGHPRNQTTPYSPHEALNVIVEADKISYDIIQHQLFETQKLAIGELPRSIFGINQLAAILSEISDTLRSLNSSFKLLPKYIHHFYKNHGYTLVRHKSDILVIFTLQLTSFKTPLTVYHIQPHSVPISVNQSLMTRLNNLPIAIAVNYQEFSYPVLQTLPRPGRTLSLSTTVFY